MNMQTLPEKWFIRKCKKEILGYHGGSLSFSFEEFLRWAGFESGGSIQISRKANKEERMDKLVQETQHLIDSLGQTC